MSIIAAAIIAATIPATTNLTEQVAILWAAHTNRLVRRAETAKRAAAKRAAGKTAVERVKENVKNRKRRSVMPKSAGGVKK